MTIENKITKLKERFNEISENLEFNINDYLSEDDLVLMRLTTKNINNSTTR